MRNVRQNSQRGKNRLIFCIRYSKRYISLRKVPYSRQYQLCLKVAPLNVALTKGIIPWVYDVGCGCWIKTRGRESHFRSRASNYSNYIAHLYSIQIQIQSTNTRWIHFQGHISTIHSRWMNTFANLWIVWVTHKCKQKIQLSLARASTLLLIQ